MLYNQIFKSESMYITNIRAMLLNSHEFITYQLDVWPYSVNGLTVIKTLYPSLVMCIDHMYMPEKTTPSRCLVKNALIAYWPEVSQSQAAVVEFRSIQKKLEIEPDIIQCKKILFGLICDKWGVRFKGKELIVC